MKTIVISFEYLMFQKKIYIYLLPILKITRQSSDYTPNYFSQSYYLGLYWLFTFF